MSKNIHFGAIWNVHGNRPFSSYWLSWILAGNLPEYRINPRTGRPYFLGWRNAGRVPIPWWNAKMIAKYGYDPSIPF